MTASATLPVNSRRTPVLAMAPQHDQVALDLLRHSENLCRGMTLFNLDLDNHAVVWTLEVAEPFVECHHVVLGGDEGVFHDVEDDQASARAGARQAARNAAIESSERSVGWRIIENLIIALPLVMGEFAVRSQRNVGPAPAPDEPTCTADSGTFRSRSSRECLP